MGAVAQSTVNFENVIILDYSDISFFR